MTNNILSDSETLAVILCELGSGVKKLNHGCEFLEECVGLIVECKYEGALQMGVDLCYRLGNGSQGVVVRFFWITAFCDFWIFGAWVGVWRNEGDL